MNGMSPVLARHLWIGLMTLASTVTTLVLACATPFPALAALAALYARRTEGVILMIAAWAASQVIGFFMLDYRGDAGNLGWSVCLAGAAISGLFAARLVLRRLENAADLLRFAGAYVAAYIGFKAIVLMGAIILNDGWAAFTPDVLARQFVRYAMIFAGLALFQWLLSGAGIRATREAQAGRA